MDNQDQDYFGVESATFGDRLVAARERAGLSPKSLAKRLGVKLTTLTAWENDVSEPRANRVSMLAGILNVSLGWLLTGQGEGVPGPQEEGAVLSPDVAELFHEIRTVRSELHRQADRLSVLEKRLRAKFQGEVQ